MSIRTGFNKVAKLTGAALRSMLWFPKNRWQFSFMLAVSILGQPLLKYTFPTAEDYVASRGYAPEIATQLTGGTETRVFEQGAHRALYNFVDIANVPFRLFFETVDLVDDALFPDNGRNFNPAIFYPKNKSSYMTPTHLLSNTCKVHIKERDHITLRNDFNPERVKDFVVFHELKHCSQEPSETLIEDIMKESEADLAAANLLIPLGQEDLVKSILFYRAITNLQHDDTHETSLYLYMHLYTDIEPTPEIISRAKHDLVQYLNRDDSEYYLYNNISLYGFYRISIAMFILDAIENKETPFLPSPEMINRVYESQKKRQPAPKPPFNNS